MLSYAALFLIIALIAALFGFGGIAAGAVDVIAFTSASQVRRLWDVARKRGLEAPLRTGLAHAVVAAVGPVTATEAARFGTNPAIMPSRV